MNVATAVLPRPVAAPLAGLIPARLALAATVVLGLGLRIAGARGGLWLDEAWSVLLAQQVGTPAGVLLGINHDNNHHLNSLWLLAVGFDAPPMLQRALSITCGSTAVVLSGLLARRFGTGAMLVTALLFAVSPLLVTLGSEARGYAPMLLAWLGAALIVDRALADEPGGELRLLLGILFFLALLSQLTAMFGLVALGGWALFTWWEREGIAVAIRRTLHLFGPALVMSTATLAILTVAAWASPTGFHFGSYERFSLLSWARGIVDMTGYAVGFPVVTVVLPLGALVLLILAPRLGVGRLWLHRLAILGFPLGLALVHVANTGHPRYYLLAGTALLLLIGQVIGAALARPGRWRIAGAVALLAMTAGSLRADLELAHNLRGDPTPAVEALVARAPAGAAVIFDRETGEGVLRVAAGSAHYPLAATSGCPARFAFVDRFGGEAMPATISRCGTVYHPIAAAHATGLSGSHWTLYERPL